MDLPASFKRGLLGQKSEKQLAARPIDGQLRSVREQKVYDAEGGEQPIGHLILSGGKYALRAFSADKGDKDGIEADFAWIQLQPFYADQGLWALINAYRGARDIPFVLTLLTPGKTNVFKFMGQVLSIQGNERAYSFKLGRLSDFDDSPSVGYSADPYKLSAEHKRELIKQELGYLMYSGQTKQELLSIQADGGYSKLIGKVVAEGEQKLIEAGKAPPQMVALDTDRGDERFDLPRLISKPAFEDNPADTALAIIAGGLNTLGVPINVVNDGQVGELSTEQRVAVLIKAFVACTPRDWRDQAFTQALWAIREQIREDSSNG